MQVEEDVERDSGGGKEEEEEEKEEDGDEDGWICVLDVPNVGPSSFPAAPSSLVSGPLAPNVGLVTRMRLFRGQGVAALSIGGGGRLLAAAPAGGTEVRVMRLGGGDGGPIVEPLYRLRRGITRALPTALHVAERGNTVVLTTAHGTSHVWAIHPDGGPPGDVEETVGLHEVMERSLKDQSRKKAIEEKATAKKEDELSGGLEEKKTAKKDDVLSGGLAEKKATAKKDDVLSGGLAEKKATAETDDVLSGGLEGKTTAKKTDDLDSETESSSFSEVVPEVWVGDDLARWGLRESIRARSGTAGGLVLTREADCRCSAVVFPRRSGHRVAVSADMARSAETLYVSEAVVPAMVLCGAQRLWRSVLWEDGGEVWAVCEDGRLLRFQVKMEISRVGVQRSESWWSGAAEAASQALLSQEVVELGGRAGAYLGVAARWAVETATGIVRHLTREADSAAKRSGFDGEAAAAAADAMRHTRDFPVSSSADPSTDTHHRAPPPLHAVPAVPSWVRWLPRGLEDAGRGIGVGLQSLGGVLAAAAAWRARQSPLAMAASGAMANVVAVQASAERSDLVDLRRGDAWPVLNNDQFRPLLLSDLPTNSLYPSLSSIPQSTSHLLLSPKLLPTETPLWADPRIRLLASETITNPLTTSPPTAPITQASALARQRVIALVHHKKSPPPTPPHSQTIRSQPPPQTNHKLQLALDTPLQAPPEPSAPPAAADHGWVVDAMDDDYTHFN